MPNKIKQKGAGTDSSIFDAVKRAKTRRKQLEAAGGVEPSNPIDDTMNELENENDQFKELFESN